jgi:hypothetical protein
MFHHPKLSTHDLDSSKIRNIDIYSSTTVKKSLTKLTGPYKSQLWNHLTLQAGEPEPYILAAAVALGAISKSWVLSSSEEQIPRQKYALPIPQRSPRQASLNPSLLWEQPQSPHRHASHLLFQIPPRPPCCGLLKCISRSSTPASMV